MGRHRRSSEASVGQSVRFTVAEIYDVDAVASHRELNRSALVRLAVSEFVADYALNNGGIDSLRHDYLEASIAEAEAELELLRQRPLAADTSSSDTQVRL